MEQKKLSDSQVEMLKKKLPAEAVKPHPTKTYLSSIKVIYIVERLNEVFGVGGWFVRNRFEVREGKMVVCHSVFTAPEYGIEHESYGGNDNTDLGDAYKGACTDALSKIASYLYIGMDVYKGLTDKEDGKKADKKITATKADPQPSKHWDDLPKGSQVEEPEAADQHAIDVGRDLLDSSRDLKELNDTWNKKMTPAQKGALSKHYFELKKKFA